MVGWLMAAVLWLCPPAFSPAAFAQTAFSSTALPSSSFATTTAPSAIGVAVVEHLRIKVPETPPVDANGDPKVVHECGISESRRRYIANVRRAARLTLSLLYMNEDVQTISSAISYMVTGKVTSQKRVSVMAHSRDVRFFAIGLLTRATAWLAGDR